MRDYDGAGLLRIENLKFKILSFLGFENAIAQEIKSTEKETQSPEIETRFVLAQFQYTDPDRDGIWTADIQTPAVIGEYEIISLISHQDPSIPDKEIRLITVIDPEGYVFRKEADGIESRLPNVSVSIYQLNPDTNEYELWNAQSYDQKNPQTTDFTGRYSFLVPAGTYYLKAETPGYHPLQTDIFEVSEAKNVHMNLEMKSTDVWKSISQKTLIVLLVIFLSIIFILIAYNFYQDKKRRL